MVSMWLVCGLSPIVFAYSVQTFVYFDGVHACSAVYIEIYMISANTFTLQSKY